MPEPYTITLPPYRASAGYTTYPASGLAYGSVAAPYPTFVGSGPSIFGDGSDSTYAEIANAQYTFRVDEPNEHIAYPIVVQWPALDYSAYVPAGWTASLSNFDVPAGLRVRGQAYAGAATAYLRVSVGSYSALASGGVFSGFTGEDFVPPIGTSITTTGVTDWFSYGYVEDFALAGNLGAKIGLGQFYADATTRLFDVWIEGIQITVTPPLLTVGPQTRQFPRDDGLATSTARRYWPTPRSLQRGTRRAGSTYP